MDKRIEVVELEISELKDNIGNPRKISGKALKGLQDSLEEFGDFGVIVVDEKNNIVCGHQRVEANKRMYGENYKVLCKRLYGYSLPELRAINIKGNTHSGEWDLSKLAEWTADLTVKVGIDIPKLQDPLERDNRKMELIRYEKYDYVLLICRNEVDYKNLCRDLGIEDKKVIVGHNSKGDRKIKARAIWYDQIKCNVTKK